MLGVFWPALLIVAAIHSAAATPLPGPIVLIDPYLENSILTVPGKLDPRFRFYLTSPGAHILNTNSGLTAITKIIHRLAECNFDGVIEPRTYAHDKFPTVSVSIKGTPGNRQIQRDLPFGVSIRQAST